MNIEPTRIVLIRAPMVVSEVLGRLNGFPVMMFPRVDIRVEVECDD